MRMRKTTINITNEYLKRLKSIVSKGKCAARTMKRAQVLLKLDAKSSVRHSNDELALMLDISKSTANNIVKYFLGRGS